MGDASCIKLNCIRGSCAFLCMIVCPHAFGVQQHSERETTLQGAQEVVKGVFMGGFEEARYGIRTGSKKAEQFR